MRKSIAILESFASCHELVREVILHLKDFCAIFQNRFLIFVSAYSFNTLNFINYYRYSRQQSL